MSLYQAISKIGRRVHIDPAINADDPTEAAKIAKNNAIKACIDATETSLLDIEVDVIQHGFRVLTMFFTVCPNRENGDGR